MKIRRTEEFEVECKGCSSLLRVGFSELRFSGMDDQRIQCPACGCRVLVVQGGMLAPGMIAKKREQTWREAGSGLAETGTTA